jgi:hypothetical protein
MVKYDYDTLNRKYLNLVSDYNKLVDDDNEKEKLLLSSIKAPNVKKGFFNKMNINKNINLIENKTLSLTLNEVADNKFIPDMIKQVGIDGYILFKKKNSNWKFIPVKNFKNVFKYTDTKSAFILDKIIGKFDNGKPFMMIDENIPITLNEDIKSTLTYENERLGEGIDLCYDSRAFYVYLDTVTLKNLTVPS